VVDAAVINSQSCGAGGAGAGGVRKRRSEFIEGLQAARTAGLFEGLHYAVGQPSHVELVPRSVLTENAYHRLAEDLAVSGPDVDRGMHLIQDKGLDLCHQVSVCLGLPWGTLYPRRLVAPPPMLSNADLLRAVRTVKDQGGLLVVSPDSPFLKRARTYGQAQVGDAAVPFAVPPGLAVGAGERVGLRGQLQSVSETESVIPVQSTTAEVAMGGIRDLVRALTQSVLETQKSTMEALLSNFHGGGLRGGAGVGRDGSAAAKKMQLDRLDVSGTWGAGNIAVFQVALTRLSDGAKNACRVALMDENPFEQSFGLSAQLQLARKDALTRSEYNPPKSPSPTFEAFGDYMAIVFAILTADAKHRANNTAANLHRKQAAAFPEGWRALVARVERANWAGANSPAALSCFVRVVMGDIPSGGERKAWRGAGLGRLMTCPGAAAR